MARLRDAAECFAGGLFLAAASPAILASAAAIRALSRRSPFIAHRRVGRGGESLWVLKLRTMWSLDAPEPRERGIVEYITEEPQDDSKNPADSRVCSRFARFIRRHSIDELPQLWQVARGEMSLVGPRPLTRSELSKHYGWHADQLLSVKPGLTGIWQTRGRNGVKFPERVAMDLELVHRLTPRIYFSILLRTVPAVVIGKGAW